MIPVDREEMRQYAPYPAALADAVEEFRFYEGWTFKLVDIARDFEDVDGRSIPTAGGLTLLIFVPCHDSYHPDRYRPVNHLHPVPAATFNRSSWERWILDRALDTLTHEACEHARFGDDPETARRPWAPLHGPGDNPYVIHDLATDLQRRTSFRGEVNA